MGAFWHIKEAQNTTNRHRMLIEIYSETIGGTPSANGFHHEKIKSKTGGKIVKKWSNMGVNAPPLSGDFHPFYKMTCDFGW